MITSSHGRSVAVIGLALVATLGACKADNTGGPLAPFQPQITNAPDNFQFQATGVTNVTWTQTYTWANSSPGASINQSTTVTSGAAVLTVFDATGAQVFSQALSANGTFSTGTGVAGNWTIEITLTEYDGTINFRVQKT